MSFTQHISLTPKNELFTLDSEFQCIIPESPHPHLPTLNDRVC